jgi:hypothetical protein
MLLMVAVSCVEWDDVHGRRYWLNPTDLENQKVPSNVALVHASSLHDCSRLQKAAKAKVAKAQVFLYHDPANLGLARCIHRANCKEVFLEDVRHRYDYSNYITISQFQ